MLGRIRESFGETTPVGFNFVLVSLKFIRNFDRNRRIAGLSPTFTKAMCQGLVHGESIEVKSPSTDVVGNLGTEYRLRCRSRYLTMAQNCENRPKIAVVLRERGTLNQSFLNCRSVVNCKTASGGR
ncbi:hypothetical protein AVEN_137298-1 [Araneus ventricosus]|uniref:Uncharacterized protein n=1 Tax=Araneus ventricosus TaxID=182803 RepID=A0A4Y2IFV9_ARAVE|nr:hypothetical protein AVEN_137298-1 [Araneus ventricosus]